MKTRGKKAKRVKEKMPPALLDHSTEVSLSGTHARPEDTDGDSMLPYVSPEEENGPRTLPQKTPQRAKRPTVL